MNKWIKVEEQLPEDGEYVLTIYNRGNWISKDGREGKHTYIVAKFLKGKLLSDNKEGPFRMQDQFENNSVPYCWDTFGPLKLFGQDVSFWMSLPEGPRK